MKKVDERSRKGNKNTYIININRISGTGDSYYRDNRHLDEDNRRETE